MLVVDVKFKLIRALLVITKSPNVRSPNLEYGNQKWSLGVPLPKIKHYRMQRELIRNNLF